MPSRPAAARGRSWPYSAHTWRRVRAVERQSQRAQVEVATWGKPFCWNANRRHCRPRSKLAQWPWRSRPSWEHGFIPAYRLLRHRPSSPSPLLRARAHQPHRAATRAHRHHRQSRRPQCLRWCCRRDRRLPTRGVHRPLPRPSTPCSSNRVVATILTQTLPLGAFDGRRPTTTLASTMLPCRLSADGAFEQRSISPDKFTVRKGSLDRLERPGGRDIWSCWAAHPPAEVRTHLGSKWPGAPWSGRPRPTMSCPIARSSTTIQPTNQWRRHRYEYRRRPGDRS